jgi:predicted NUDIX family phosphoesterase
MPGNEKQTNQSDTGDVESVDCEQQTYLRVAETVLGSALSPLNAREIVERGIERGLFGDHALSRTPEKSMQARLSMDILNRAEQSTFVRSERGRFTLRSKLSDRPAPDRQSVSAQAAQIHEYVAQRRVLRTPKEEVLCFSEPAFREVLTFQGIDTDAGPILDKLLTDKGLLYVPRSEAEARDDAKQLVTYVLVQCGQRLLFFKRSYLSRAAEFLRGSKCIGFGGHVSAADADILSLDDRGVSWCARRELIEELHYDTNSRISPALPPRGGRVSAQSGNSITTEKLFVEASLEHLGVLNDDSSKVGRRHLAVVYRVWLPDWDIARRIQKGESSIKGLGWIDLSKDKVDISEYEYWSQLCLRKFYPSTVISKSGFRVLRDSIPAKDSLGIVVAGKIGSGKTETARYLSEKLAWPLIKSGFLMQELMRAPPITEIGRKEFQARAFDFIRADCGPQRLAERLATQIAALNGARCIIDGIRHLATYEGVVRSVGRGLNLMYVQTPPDVAYDLYRTREVQGTLTFSYREFLEIYDAPVESEIESLGRRADLYIYNSFGMDAFRRTLDEVALRLSGVAPSAARPIRQGKARAR